MQLYFDILDHKLPSYGLMIVIGIILANLLALCVLKKFRQELNDVIILEAYAFLGGFFGAKLLYFAVSYKQIEWKRITEIEYFNQLMQSGFVFYGGLILALVFVLGAGQLHKLPAKEFLRDFIFLIPLIHCFGRIGCFFAGCCYGIPYDGIGAVVFPEHSLAVPGVPLYPVQLVEAVLLMLISLTILILRLKLAWKYTVETYLVAYGIVRFILEFYRYDDARGGLYKVSTSQWISLLLIVAVIVSLLYSRLKLKQEKKTYNDYRNLS